MKTNYTFQKKYSKLFYSFMVLTLSGLFITISDTKAAITMPTPQNLPYSQDFSSLTGSAPTYPAGWQAWQVAGAAPSSTGRINVPTSDKTISAGTAASTGSGAYDFDGKIGFLSVGSSDVTLCLALNTTGNNNIKIMFDAMTIRNLWDGTNAVNYQNGLVLQYRVGESATFTNLTYAPSEYLSGTTVQTTAVTTGINPVTGLNAFLPAECENQAIVQVRWIYRNAPGGTSGSRPSMALDNISVQQIPVTFTSGWAKAENPTASGFTAKSNINTPGTTYFVVLASGATAPSSAQVKAGQDASGTDIAVNEKGSITNTLGSSEYVAAVSGLTSNTTYDVYFAAEGNSGASLMATPQKISVTTTASAAAPTIIHPTASTITTDGATLGGEITSDGGSPILERGTVWKTTTGVTIADNKLAEGLVETGIFSQSRTLLPAKSKIYYKAYAINALGTTLTDEASFFTKAIEPLNAVGSFTATPTAGSSTSLDLSWTASTDADGYLIIIRAGSTGPGTVPADLTLYSVGDGIGTGTVAAFINSGSVTSQVITGLASNQLYSIRIYPFGFDGTNAETINYTSTFETTQGTTPIETALNSTNSIIKLYALSNEIIISGGNNKNILVTSLTGQLILNKLITSDIEKINLKNGFYIISIGDKRFKIQVKK